jgi:hypothetical protein
MEEVVWDLTGLAGQPVFVVIADLSSGDWGHISVDGIREYTHSGPPDDPVPPMEDGPNLDQILIDAGYDPLSAVPGEAADPPGGRLMPAQPNPFNPRTRLRYEINHPGQVELMILDADGRLVRRLFTGALEAGPGYFTWDGRDDAGRRTVTGLYLARLTLDGEFLGSQKLTLLE